MWVRRCCQSGRWCPRLNTGRGRGGSLRDVVSCSETGEILTNLVVHHINGGHQHKRQHKVGEPPASAISMRCQRGWLFELTGVVRHLFAGNLARHFHVSAQWQRIDLVVGAAALEANHPLAEADGEGLHPHAAPLGHREMAKFMHQHHEAEHQKKFKNCGHKIRNFPFQCLAIKLRRVRRGG